MPTDPTFEKPNEKSDKSRGLKARLSSAFKGKQNQSSSGNPNATTPPPKNGLWTWILFGVALVLLVSIYLRPDFPAQQVDFSVFLEEVEGNKFSKVVISGAIAKGVLANRTTESPVLEGAPQASSLLSGTELSVKRKSPPLGYHTSIIVENGGMPVLIEKLMASKVPFEQESAVFRNIFLQYLLPVLFFVLLWRLVFSRAFKMGPGAGLMSFGKNRARLVQDDSKKVTFDDVAGCDEAKDELTEIIDFLKSPEKFRAIGGKIPKGILLVGPPGTGKTLLAKAVAGEASVPFFSLSGSEFVEMFVGVGAARVRDLFSQAVEKSPCIIFIDELDAIGKARSAVSPMGGHDEREQTLNQLLVEMDGFDAKAGVIIMAATNRPETLDPALLRAGRFDRQVLVDRPDIKGREAILRIHAKNVKMEPSADLKVVAARTPGFVGADLANVVNEAALLAVRKGKTSVQLSDFDDAVDRVVAGLQKKTRLMNTQEKLIVAYHETGHALVTYFTRGADPVHKVSVIPRGFGALGFTMALPKEDRYLLTQHELLARIDILFGGRVAEEVVFSEVSTGAQDDLQKATDLAKRMVMEFGMTKAFGQRTFSAERSTFIASPAGPISAAKEYSDATAQMLDAEIQGILVASYDRVIKLIQSKKALLAQIAEVLQEKEVIDGKELDIIIRKFEGVEVKKGEVDSLQETPLSIEKTVSESDSKDLSN